MRLGLDKANDKPAGGGNRPATNFFKWEGGETKYVRFLTDGDEIAMVYEYGWVKCQDGKGRTFVDRSEFGHADEFKKATYVNPRGEQAKRSEKGYGVAVEREPVFEEIDGKVVQTGFKDKTTKVDGKTVPICGIVSQSPSNFWTFIDAHYKKRGSLLGYDLEITRKGDGTDTLYIITPELPGEEIPNIRERYSNYAPDHVEYLEALASARYYNKHLGLDLPVEDDKGAKTQTADEPEDESGTSDDVDDMAEFAKIQAAQAEVLAAQNATKYE